MSYKIQLLLPIGYFTLNSILFIYLGRYSTPNLVELLGILVTTISYILWVSARLQLKDAFSIHPKTKKLVTTGLYKKISHPVYVFQILVLLGISIFLQKPILLIGIGIVIILQIYRAKKENKILSEAFPKEYKKYKEQVWI